MSSQFYLRKSSSCVPRGEPILFLRNSTGISVNDAARGRELSGFLYMRSSGNGLRGFGGRGRILCFWWESLGVGGNSQGSRLDPEGS